MDVPDPVIEIGLPFASLAVWAAVYWITRLASRPAAVTPAPAAMEFPGQEPPAVVSLLANRWRITVDAAESTLLDLAARHYLELRQTGPDPRHTTVHLAGRAPEDLNRYERQVFDRVAERAVDGVVPLTALGFADAGRSAAWSKRLRRSVLADARRLGLSRRRFSRTLVVLLSVLGGVAGAGVAAGAWHYVTRSGEDQFGFVAAFLVTTVALAGVAVRDLGERDTPTGRTVAARWLGLRAWLAGHESFADLPPAAVAVWDRYLAYGAALGVTRVASHVIDLGMADRRRLWSSYGGRWRRVSVSYPGGLPRYGQALGWIVFRALIAALLGWTFARVVGGLFLDSAGQSSSDGRASWTRLAEAGPVTLGIVALGFALLGLAGYLLLRALLDLVAPATVTGEVLWHQVWQRQSSDDGPGRPINHHLVIDDGHGDQLRAWILPQQIAGECRLGDVVTARVRPWTRRVIGVGVQRAAPEPADLGADADDETLADADLPATATHAAVRPDRLLTAAEVSAATGRRVSLARAEGTAGQVRGMAAFVDGRGATVLGLHVGRGVTAQFNMTLGRATGTPLPGVGDEAYAGPDRVVGRRGDLVLLLLRGPGGGGIEAAQLSGLLATALSRLPSEPAPQPSGAG
ncbi:hypothetical protein AB0C04_13795 [Micromonospora sp. NPDC048909]|uniref:DUF2207 family protein n=1 Tax=Micromonospora sp. NPDC048909 TaxID=3155643 RepID=UPI0033C1314F